jgi:hypothetical protein
MTKAECQHATCRAIVLTEAERFHLRPAAAGQAAPTSAWSCRHCLARRSFTAKADTQHCAPAAPATRGPMPPPPPGKACARSGSEMGHFDFKNRDFGFVSTFWL